MSDTPPPLPVSVHAPSLEPSSLARPEPVSPDERIESLDVLRGFALFGVLFVNGMSWFRTHPGREYLNPDRWTSFADRVVRLAQELLMDGKFITLFAFLFGVGMAIQADRAEARGGRPRRFLIRRMLVLFAIGAAHVLLLWMGDILHVYAVLGLPFLLFVKRKTRTVAITTAVILLLPLLLSAIYSLVKLSSGEPPIRPRSETGELLGPQIDAAVRVYSSGTWMEIARQRLSDAANLGLKMLPSFPSTFAMFLLGMLAHRRGIFANPAAHRRTLWTVLIGGGALGITTGVVFLPFFLRPAPGEMTASAYICTALFGLVPLGQSGLGLAYGAGLLLLLQRPAIRAWLAPVGKVGRMALTNYLTESLLCSLVFYGFGLGLYDRLRPVSALPIFLAIYAAHVLWSGPWLARFRYGPVEWLWRSLTYGKAQPMRAARPAPASPRTATR